MSGNMATSGPLQKQNGQTYASPPQEDVEHNAKVPQGEQQELTPHPLTRRGKIHLRKTLRKCFLQRPPIILPFHRYVEPDRTSFYPVDEGHWQGNIEG